MKIFIFYLLLILISKLSSCFIYKPSHAVEIPEECRKDCVTPFNTIIGSNRGVVAYSNCNDKCINRKDEGVYYPKLITDYLDDVYTGMRWQCVEYARRWLITHKGASFESIDAAYEIFDLKTVKDLTKTEATFPFEPYKNGNKIPPQVGDLLIYPIDREAPYGHVTVITDVKLELGLVYIGEQNYSNGMWEDPNSFARRIILEKRGDEYFLTKTYKENLQEIVEEESAPIGWKRVIKP